MVTTGITFTVVRHGLMEYTNFSVGGLEYAYEDVASSILASPKSYIVLVTTAFIASRLNLLYGWEYSGILIPALLALQWYQPTKLVASVVEAWVILLAGDLLLRLPFLQRRTIERASKVVLFFTVSYAYKFVLALVLLQTEVKVSDAYGFGYLLPSLLAVKMHEKRLGLRMTRFTLQTTLVSAAAALAVGFGLSLLTLPLSGSSGIGPGESVRIERRQETLEEVVDDLRIAGYRGRLADSYRRPTPAELGRLASAGSRLARYAVTPDETTRNALLGDLAASGLVLEEVGDEFPARSRSARDARLGLRSRAQRSERRHRRGGAPRGRRASVAAGGSPAAAALRRARPCWSPEPHATLSRTAQRTCCGARTLPSSPSTGASPETTSCRSEERPFAAIALTGSRSTPRGACRRAWTSRRSKPCSASTRSTSRRRTRSTCCATAPCRASPSCSSTPAANGNCCSRRSPEPLPASTSRTIDGYLQAWLRDDKGRIAGRGSDAYVQPGIEELLFFDEAVLTPLLREVRPSYRNGGLAGDADQILAQTRREAALLGYDVIWYRHRETGTDYLILLETREPQRHWGTYVFRLGGASPYLVEIPRPLFELNTFEAGLSLFERLDADTLLIAGSHPFANRSGAADVVHPQNQASVFSLVNQAVMREAGSAHQLAVVMRAFATRPEGPRGTGDADAMIALAEGAPSREDAGATTARLVELLEADERRVVFVDGAAATAGYEVSNLPQARYLDQVPNKQLAILWLSTEVRESFRQADDARLLSGLLDAFGMAAQEADVARTLDAATWRKTSVDRRDELVSLFGQLLSSADAVALDRLRRQWQWSRIDRVQDRDTGQEHLVFYDASGAAAAAVNLQSAVPPEVSVVTDHSELAAALDARRAITLLESAG